MTGLMIGPTLITNRLTLTSPLSFAATGLTVVVGDNGAGKSTLLDAISGVIKGVPCILDGQRLDVLSPSQRAARIASLGSTDGSDDRMTVFDRVLHGFFAAPIDHALARAAARRMIDELGLAAVVHRPLSQLSRGQLRRVQVARALVDDRPPVVLLDEPLAGVDPGAAATLCGLLQQRATKAQVVVVMHDLLWPFHIATRVVGLAAGQVVFDGYPDQLNDEAQQRVWPGLPWRLVRRDHETVILNRLT
jgi:ABC-type cobalamin/Fe3+-siderophores transport system ATPase subunit